MADDEAPPRYKGPFVVIEPVGFAYTVSINPAPASGVGAPRTFGSKHEAFGAARDLWTANRLPLRDMTLGQVAAHSARKGARKKS
ncbi:hypothetical protein GRI43_13670 [Altererythrobacter luteolus]|uniref:Uncharacterized protein n=1 Tax=Pontixanthobacter luteolus TaxID=295089 RepID=A0A6I4V2M8_9SPHN|nr:hypothetical protein [Pontixanthobacter luteolus]MXP48437.1 hypothetical protein [Pontixanthobacter luteolus]